MGAVRIYHNTTYYDDPGHTAWASIGSGHTHFINNVVASTAYVFEDTSARPYPEGNVWDYNNFYTTDPTRYIKWENVRLDVAGFRARGFQLHGISEPPRFRNPEARDLRLLPDDPGIDRALPLPGINDGYFGPGPDIGAFEFVPEVAAARGSVK